jgi:hypothetical protein
MFNPCCCSTFTCYGCTPGTEVVGGWEIEIDGVADGTCTTCEGYNGLYYVDDFDGQFTTSGSPNCLKCSEKPQSVIDDTTTRPAWAGAVGCDDWVYVLSGGPFEPAYWIYRWHQICIRTESGGFDSDAYIKVRFQMNQGNLGGAGTFEYAYFFAIIGGDAQDSRYNPIDCNLIDYDMTLESNSSVNVCDFTAATCHIRAL